MSMRQKDGLVARRSFLEKAAVACAHHVPAVSAYMQSSTNNLPANSTRAPSNYACAACGTLLITGENETISLARTARGDHIAGSEKSSVKKSNGKAALETHLINTCTTCTRYTKFPVQQKPRTKRRVQIESAHVAPVASPPVINDVAGIGKRKKRKKAAGLQAMLDKAESAKKVSQNSFDFLDLMQAPRNG